MAVHYCKVDFGGHLAYNAVNYSFYPEKGEKRWWAEISSP